VVTERLKDADRVALFLDFDGTLVPIESHPAAPRLTEYATQTLRSLLERDYVVTTILSGRSIEDLSARIHLDGLIYAGNHGLEIIGRGLQFTEPRAAARSEELEQVCDELSAELGDIRGALVEYKGLTASVHYRCVDPSAQPRIEQAVRDALARSRPAFRLNRGRKVLELMPRTAWDKGAAVRWIVEKLGDPKTLAVCLGDDSSDEHAFAALPDAITVKVGTAGPTHALYRLKDPAAVHEFLRLFPPALTSAASKTP